VALTLRQGLVLLAAALTAAFTARLGVWQLDRAAQKTQAQAQLEARRAMPVLRVSELALEAKDAVAQKQRSVMLTGLWQPQFTIYLDNRQMNKRPGFFAVTPLLLDDGTAVLVQRGWLPRDIVSRTRITAPATPTGPVQVLGRIQPLLSQSFELSSAAESGAIRQNLAIDRYALEIKLALRPLAVVQDDAPKDPPTSAPALPSASSSTSGAVSAPSLVSTSAPPSDGLLRQWPAPATGVEKHHGYAFQWFALSALSIGLYAWFQIIRPRRRASRAAQPQPSAHAANAAPR
jgi:surfeit locus 1 family protein